ncbi:iron transporter [Actinokineospora bangkokensis]|uniref:Fe2+ transport protein n=1 Tax=Actinokineospora bangkokensis TaxID=1193682 RepID=A0A1Q9LNP5_9PSEU|nr:iron transporter [Actinokineospora bangkokensis]OLR93623.1 hypothetical protein BJP25_15200 [Actinokineospora bangkokensis]
MSTTPLTTPPRTPPMSASNEADPDQLQVAREQGEAYHRALNAMLEESGGVVERAGEYTVVLVQEGAEGMYGLHDGELVWHEAAEGANGHLEVAVADAADGRFVPGLEVTATVLRGDRPLFTAHLPFLWHPFLHHYGANVRIPGEGAYTVQVRIEPPAFMRHDPVNGKRYAEPVDVTFTDVTFRPGRKPSPEAGPRGEDASYYAPPGER